MGARGDDDTSAMAGPRGAWPGVEVPEAAFAAYLAERADAQASNLNDLYLACACVEGDPKAMAAFERAFLAPLPEVIVRAGFPPDVGADVTQALRERLLMAADGRPARIATYRGAAPLSAWLRVTAIREAGRARRESRLEGGQQEMPSVPLATPEDDAIRARYGPVFARAFGDAMAALPADDRLALRLHFAEGLNLEGLAAALGFSRATAGRRLLQARTRLREETLRLVGERLEASPDEAESVLRALGSSLDVSFAALVTTVA